MFLDVNFDIDDALIDLFTLFTTHQHDNLENWESRIGKRMIPSEKNAK